MSEKVKIKVFVSTNKVGSKTERIIEVDRDEYDEMLPLDIEDMCKEVMYDMIIWDFEVVE